MAEKLHEYEGVLGRVHALRDRVRGVLDDWRESRGGRPLGEWLLAIIKEHQPPREEHTPVEPPPGILGDNYAHIYRRKTRAELVRVSAAVMGIEFSYAAETAFVSPTLLKIGVEHKHMTLVWALSPLVGFFLTPVLGSLSDRCRLPFGRRRPFIVVLAIGVLVGLILVPNGEDMGHSMGDYYPSKDLPAANRTALLAAGTPVNDAQYSHPWGVFFTILGTVLLDFDADACQSPARAYLLDVTVAEDHARGLSTFTVMAGLGGFLGYALGGINWDATAIGEMLGGHVRAVFTLITFIFVTCVAYTVTSFQEVPLDVLERERRPSIAALNQCAPLLQRGDAGAGPRYGKMDEEADGEPLGSGGAPDSYGATSAWDTRPGQPGTQARVLSARLPARVRRRPGPGQQRAAVGPGDQRLGSRGGGDVLRRRPGGVTTPRCGAGGPAARRPCRRRGAGNAVAVLDVHRVHAALGAHGVSHQPVLLERARVLLAVLHGLRRRGGVRRRAPGAGRLRVQGAVRGGRALRLLGHVHVLAVVRLLLPRHRAADPPLRCAARVRRRPALLLRGHVPDGADAAPGRRHPVLVDGGGHVLHAVHHAVPAHRALPRLRHVRGERGGRRGGVHAGARPGHGRGHRQLHGVPGAVRALGVHGHAHQHRGLHRDRGRRRVLARLLRRHRRHPRHVPRPLRLCVPRRRGFDPRRPRPFCLRAEPSWRLRPELPFPRYLHPLVPSWASRAPAMSL